jgi:hypothetical protein
MQCTTSSGRIGGHSRRISATTAILTRAAGQPLVIRTQSDIGATSAVYKRDAGRANRPKGPFQGGSPRPTAEAAEPGDYAFATATQFL